ncbi:hypothetical protein EV650_6367 [Kribbella kalugense]|uniref:Uncharacterized protein n=1 Tax=Kribbella kalugense TaxID=2512221 RepID=A0A4R7ZBM7_9ACTN|nr:hypothetical protein EV650_6367 [Kribbella kalugense]
MNKIRLASGIGKGKAEWTEAASGAGQREAGRVRSPPALARGTVRRIRPAAGGLGWRCGRGRPECPGGWLLAQSRGHGGRRLVSVQFDR